MEWACSTSRMQPSAASVSSVSQRSDWENAVAERTQPGAAWKSSIATSVALPLRMSQSASHCSNESRVDGLDVGR